MAEVFGNGGQAVEVSGDYECSECGHRIKLLKGATFPPDHHSEKPWILYLAAEEVPSGQAT